MKIMEEKEGSVLAYLAYAKHKNLDIGYYFRSRGFKKIAFWGLTRLSLTVADYLSEDDNISVIGIFELNSLKLSRKVDYLNYESNINFVPSERELFKIKDLDLILVSGSGLENVKKGQEENAAVSILELASTILSHGFKRAITTALFESTKKFFVDKGIVMKNVKIPSDEKEMGIPVKTMTETDKKQWFLKENDWKNEQQVTEFARERYAFQKSVIKRDGQIYFADFKGNYINYINKSRVIPNALTDYENTIWILGPCVSISLFCTEQHTFGFYLQQKCLEGKKKYRVVAIGAPNDADRYYFFHLINNVKEGDRIYWVDQAKYADHWDLDATELFKKLYDQYGNDFYYDKVSHCGKDGMRALAGAIWKDIQDTGMLPQKKIFPNDSSINNGRKLIKTFSGNIELEEYKEFLAKEKAYNVTRVGGIVMNCNPFTYGHQYLIETAARQVNFLYIFVVEEDKSFFKFSDRIRLVREGTKHLKNVKVLPSGKFIISSNTFSEYFDKANLKGTVVDTSLDVRTFAEEIAPVLDISVRFVGEEPLDPITNQYNQSMKEILPEYGIELREIQRKEYGEGVISASRVRQDMKEGKWEEIRSLVPETTYAFLSKNYKTWIKD